MVGRTPAKYWAFVGIQSLGQLIILVLGIPAYRRLLDGQAFDEGQIPTGIALWLGAAVILSQVAYWANFRSGFAGWPKNHWLFGHLTLFLARLNFIFIAGVFSASVFLRYDVIDFTLLNLGLLVAVLFSGFCYTLELERIGRSLVL